MSTREQFLAEVERFLRESGVSASAFGQQAMGDKNFVRGLRLGKSVTLDTADRVRRFMEASLRPLGSRRSLRRRTEAAA